MGWLVEQEALSEGVGHAQATPGTSASITYNVLGATEKVIEVNTPVS